MDEDEVAFARIEVISREGDQVMCQDTSNLEPHIDALTTHLKGTVGMDGDIEGEPVSILGYTGSGITSISEG